VRTNTVLGPGSDAAVVRIRGTDRALALKTDCNGRHVHLDPREGAKGAVAEAARNVACAGGRPMAITNNLNFGNPKRPEVYFQLREAIAGMGEACRALGTPVTGGNVSLYNENPGGAVYPTPVVGMVGLLDSVAHATRAPFRAPGDAIVLFGEPTDELGGSEYLARIHGVVAGAPPRVNLAGERALIDAVLDAIRAGGVASAHDCSDGGLAVALAECAIMDPERPLGFDVDLSAWRGLPFRALLFGEAHGRVVLSGSSAAPLLEAARRHGVPAREIGRVMEVADGARIVAGTRTLRAPLALLATAYHDAIPAIMRRSPAATEAAAINH
jgi:phosphoribosylformylglycinamidine synthase